MRAASCKLAIPLFGLLALLLLGGACSSDDGGEPTATVEPLVRSPETAIVIPAGVPIIIGISLPLTGPVGAAGSEDRDAVRMG